MTNLLRSKSSFTLVAATLLASTAVWGQDPPKPEPKAEPPKEEVKAERQQFARPVLEFKEEIKPLTPVAIPDDPPPHEGSFFDLPLTIEPPDIIIVELIEALPGRPITGERLVRPDGTISLGFYGDVHVRGLTLAQAKSKIIIHMRKHLLDDILGLLVEEGEAMDGTINEEGQIVLPGGGRNPFNLEAMPEKKVDLPFETVPPGEAKPEPGAKPAGPKETKPEAKPAARFSRRGRQERSSRRRFRPSVAQNPIGAETSKPAHPQEPKSKPEPEMEEVEVVFEPQWMVVSPADSNRVFVDITSHNSTVYFVQGDVGVPGRLPFTGRETVLDALNYAGGLLPSSEPADIHLYRPARGGKPAKDYKIDLDAIRKGEATANLQVFPNDRLIVGRNPIVAKMVEVDRAAGLVNSVLNSSGAPTKPIGQKLSVSDWAEFLWSISNKEGGAMLDEKAFKEALMKKLAPAPEPK